MNSAKSVGMLFSKNRNFSLKQVSMDNINIKFVTHTKFLGLWIDKDVTWNKHVSRINQKIHRNLHLFRSRKNFLNIHSK